MSVARAKAPAPITATPLPPSTAAARGAAGATDGSARSSYVSSTPNARSPSAGWATTRYASAASSIGKRCVVSSDGFDAAGSHEIEERLHVALLRPADVAGGEVAAALLVVAVVAAGAVRAGHAELELLLVHGRAVDVDPRLADDDDAAAVAREARRRARAGRRRRTRRRGARRRGRARPSTAWTRGSSEASSRRSAVAPTGRRARPRRRRGRCRPRGSPRRARSRAASCPTSPSPITPTALAEPDLGLADAVQRDRADRRVRGVLERDAVGDRRDEVPRHGEDLGVVRALAAAGDAVAGRDALDPVPDLEHDPGGRVADRRERRRAGRARCRARSGSPRRAPCRRPS